METAKRLLKEFWLPMFLAIIWTSYNLYSAVQLWSFKDAVNIFAPTFFLASWIVAQFFRVRKQAAVEQNFDQIINTITGGETYPLVGAILREPSRGSPTYPYGLLLSPRGDHSLYDLTVIVTDIDRLRTLHASGQAYSMDQYQQRFQLGTLGRAYEQRFSTFESESRDRYSFHIQSFARNGQFNQRLLLRKVSGNWFEARCVHRNGKKITEYLQTGFPADQLPELNPEVPIL
ncbi:MAG: hypothetical protein ACREX9_22970 [Gammaproteobacteria bacterium]